MVFFSATVLGGRRNCFDLAGVVVRVCNSQGRAPALSRHVENESEKLHTKVCDDLDPNLRDRGIDVAGISGRRRWGVTRSPGRLEALVFFSRQN